MNVMQHLGLVLSVVGIIVSLFGLLRCGWVITLMFFTACRKIDEMHDSLCADKRPGIESPCQKDKVNHD